MWEADTVHEVTDRHMREQEDDRDMRFVNNIQVDECTVPEGMTLAEWRRANAPAPRKGLRARMRRVRGRGERSSTPPPGGDR